MKRLREWAGGAPEQSARGRAAPPAAREPAVTEQVAAMPPRPARSRRGRTGTRSTRVLAGLLAVAGVAAYGVSQLAGGDGGDRPGETRANDDGAPQESNRSRAVVTPGAVTVAVLNGTTVDGLAAALRNQIAAAGFKRGAIDVFSDQQLTESVVEYVPGHLPEARAVGRIVGIPRCAPVSAGTRALARGATVIVIVGADTAP